MGIILGQCWGSIYLRARQRQEHPFAGDTVEGGRTHHLVAQSPAVWPTPVIPDAEKDVGAIGLATALGVYSPRQRREGGGGRGHHSPFEEKTPIDLPRGHVLASGHGQNILLITDTTMLPLLLNAANRGSPLRPTQLDLSPDYVPQPCHQWRCRLSGRKGRGTLVAPILYSMHPASCLGPWRRRSVPWPNQWLR